MGEKHIIDLKTGKITSVSEWEAIPSLHDEVPDDYFWQLMKDMDELNGTDHFGKPKKVSDVCVVEIGGLGSAYDGGVRSGIYPSFLSNSDIAKKIAFEMGLGKVSGVGELLDVLRRDGHKDPTWNRRNVDISEAVGKVSKISSTTYPTAPFPKGGLGLLPKTKEPMKVYKAIAKVMALLGTEGIAKDRKNAAQGYQFRGIDDIYNALNAALVEAGLVIVPRILEREMVETVAKSGGRMAYVTVKAEFDFICVEDGSKHTATTFGEAMDSADKATNKAMSAAYKYVAMQTFCIPTEGDNDADAHTPEVKPATGKKAPKAATSTHAEDLARMGAYIKSIGTSSEQFTWLKEKVGTGWVEVALLAEKNGVTDPLDLLSLVHDSHAAEVAPVVPIVPATESA